MGVLRDGIRYDAHDRKTNGDTELGKGVEDCAGQCLVAFRKHVGNYENSDGEQY